ncbi:MAG: hypothetical protein ACXV4Z_06755 [Halobacteriota archaeon]
MTDVAEHAANGVDLVLAPCNKCVFVYRRCTREHDAYRASSNRPTCAWYMTGVPSRILQRKTECSHYVESTSR